MANEEAADAAFEVVSGIGVTYFEEFEDVVAPVLLHAAGEQILDCAEGLVIFHGSTPTIGYHLLDIGTLIVEVPLE